MAEEFTPLSLEDKIKQAPLSPTGDELRGYLHKKTKQGKWQRRWFETNGCFLTYYKKQGQKLLAALNLPQVGSIHLLKENDDDGPGFTIELNDRMYIVRAANQQEAVAWVEGLKSRQSPSTSPKDSMPTKNQSKEKEDKIALISPSQASIEAIRMTDSSLSTSAHQDKAEKHQVTVGCCCVLQ